MATTDKSLKTVVLLAAYNGEKYIGEQIRSILDQTDPDLVIAIHDDGSTDGTAAVIARLAESEPDRIRILDGPANGSAKANFLWMLSQVEADLYLFSDQDDVWLPKKAEKEKAALHALEHASGSGLPLCVFSDMYVVDENLKILSDSFVRDLGRSVERTAYQEVIIDNPAAGCTMLFNRALRDIAVSADPDISRIEMHDQYLLALAALCGRVTAVPEPLVYYRQHQSNVMGAEEEESRAAKILRNLRLFASGEFAAGKAAFHEQKRMLAGELAKVDAVPADKRQVLMEFAEIGGKGKLQRIAFYRKHDFSRMTGSFWMRLWV